MIGEQTGWIIACERDYLGQRNDVILDNDNFPLVCSRQDLADLPNVTTIKLSALGYLPRLNIDETLN
jgi:hypothetical protein